MRELRESVELNSKTDGTQLVCTVVQSSKVIGYVVIDSTIRGHSIGGLRMLPDIDEQEMRLLAHTMTLKYGFLGLPHGGAKAGVLCDPEAPQEKRRQCLATFGRTIAPLLLNRVYIPGTDMGTDNEDISYILKVAGIKPKRRDLQGTQSGYYTALTVFTGAKQAARHLNMSMSQCSVAIEGFGSVGRSLGELFANANARVVAISTSRGAIFNPKGLDMKQLIKLATEAGSQVIDLYTEAERIDCSSLLELPVDLLFPCARHNSINEDNSERVKARVISPGANNPITPEAERTLFKRGVLCLPDFVTNCGGVLGGTMEFASVRRGRIEAFIDRYIGARIDLLLSESASHRVLPRDIAEPYAMNRFDRMRRDADHFTLFGRLFQAGLELYRRGGIPGHVVAPLSLPYFKRLLT
ncbi:MAG: Glu/Leu/Phe/Val family dehydrogenase [Thermodesulfobacteriota bacterium]